MSNPDVDPDLLAWIVLSRVNDGNVVMLDNDYFDHGIRIPAYLAGPVAELAASGSVALAPPDQTGQRQVTITNIGYARYADLRGIPPWVNSPTRVTCWILSPLNDDADSPGKFARPKDE